MLQTAELYFLKNHTLLANLKENQLNDLHGIIRIKSFKKGTAFRLNSDEVYLLMEGKVKMSEIDQDGQEIIKEIISDGGFFGKLGQEDKNACEMIEVLTYRALVCVISSSSFEWFLEKNPDLAVKFSQTVWNKFRQTENKYANLVLKDARTRLIHFLKDWALKEGKKEGNKITLKNYLTQEEIASLVCATRVTVTSILNALRKEGLIRYSKKHIEIPDIQALCR